MTEQMKFEQVSEEVLSPGQVLSQAREAQGLSVEELSELIKVPVDVVEAIEKDKVPKNLPETFVRGYIRSYAKKVGVSEDSVLKSVVTTAAYEKVETGSATMQSFSRRTKRKAFERRLVLTTWVIGGLLALSLGIWWYQEKGMDFAPLASFTAQESTEAEQGTTVEIPVPATKVEEPAFSEEALESVAEEPQQELSQEQSQEQPQESTTEIGNPSQNEVASLSTDLEQQSVEQTVDAQLDTVNTQAEQAADASDNDATQEQAPIVLTQEQSDLLADNGEVDEEGFMKVEMKFENDCWVEVYDVSGERIAIGNKPAGYLMTLNAQGPFNVLLGNPVGVSIWVNGEEFDTTSLPRNRVARFELDTPAVESPEVVQ